METEIILLIVWLSLVSIILVLTVVYQLQFYSQLVHGVNLAIEDQQTPENGKRHLKAQLLNSIAEKLLDRLGDKVLDLSYLLFTKMIDRIASKPRKGVIRRERD